jgi:hypothetical protein
MNMTPEEFVSAIKLVVFDAAASEEALRPSGRRPHEVLAQMWDWYSGLPDRDQALVRHSMRIAAYGAVFGFLAVLDGASVIDDPPHGTLQLTYVNPDGTRLQLNRPEIEELHGLWTNEVFPYTEQLPD